MKKRVLSLFLALTLCLTLLPTAALAAEPASAGTSPAPIESGESAGAPFAPAGVGEDTAPQNSEGSETAAASVTTSGSETTNYTSLDAALDAAKDGDTVKLLGDAVITKWRSLTAAITLDLNGKTVTTQSRAELYIHAQVIVRDNSTGKTGKMAGTTLLNVQSNGDLIIQSGTFNGKITINVGKLTIKGGTFNEEVDLRGGDSDSVFFSGGTFTKLFYPTYNGPFLNLLADGYAFYYTESDELVNAAEINGYFLENVQVQQHTHSFSNGACACGYTCPHTSVDANGACPVCGMQFAASVTVGEDVTYYNTFDSALVYAAKNDSCTLKLLADVTGTTVMINNPFIFDLNGHNVDQGLSTNAKATIKDSGTTKGKIGKVTVSNGKVSGLTLGSLLEEGYAFKYENGYWANDSYLQTSEGSFVTVEKAPIQSVNVYAKDKNNKEVSTTIAYGTTGEVTLVARCQMSETSGKDLSCAWYKLTDDAAIPPLEGATSYTLPDNLSAGTHTYRVTFTSNYYSKSAEITITVTPISLKDATVTVQNPTYNGQNQFPTVTVKLGENITLTKDKDFYVDATMQTDAGSYTLTVKGMGNYTGEIKNVKWKVEPMKIDSVMVSSNISKVYDGTAEINMTAEEWAKVLTFKTLPVYPDVEVPSGAYTISDAYFVAKNAAGECAASPDAGEKYGITFKITLKSSNYVLQNYYDEEPAASKEYTQSGGANFTIEQADAPNMSAIWLEQCVFNGLAKTYEIDLKTLLPERTLPCEYGDITYGAPNVTLNDAYYDAETGAKIENGKLLLPIKATSTENRNIGTVTVEVSSTNYQTFTLTLNVIAQEKITLDQSGVNVSASDITYGQTLADSKLTVEGAMKCPRIKKDIPGTFAWKDGTSKPNAGSYEAEWTFTPAEGYEEYAPATGKVTVTVNRAATTGAPKYTKITAGGKTLKDAALTIEGSTLKPSAGTLEWVNDKGEALPDDTRVEANTTYKWRFTPADPNYAPLTGEIELYHVPVSGGPGSGSYAIAVKDAKNGDVITDRRSASAGTTVTITVKPDSGYALDDLTVTDSKGNALKLTGKGGGKYTFTMPVGKVTIAVSFAPAKSGDPFTDVPSGAYYEDAVLWAVGRGIAQGTDDAHFSPGGACSRAQAVTFLWRAAGSPAPRSTAMPFADVPAGSYYYDAVLWAIENGIAKGTGGTAFSPDAACTRAQIAAFLYRYMQSQGKGFTGSWMFLLPFTDVPEWCYEAVAWCYMEKVTVGTAAATFSPDADCTRAQIVTFIYRCMK